MTDHPSILIVEARFYSDIADQLVAGAITALDGAEFDDGERVGVHRLGVRVVVDALAGVGVRSAGVGVRGVRGVGVRVSNGGRGGRETSAQNKVWIPAGRSGGSHVRRVVDVLLSSGGRGYFWSRSRDGEREGDGGGGVDDGSSDVRRGHGVVHIFGRLTRE